MKSAPPGFSLTRLAIRQHIGTLMLSLAIVVLGFFALTKLPVDLLPAITYPRIGLRVSAPGLVPQVAVDEVTRPLEEALSVTPGVTQVFSRTREGSINIDLYFEPGSNVDQALNDATASLNRVRGSLPDSVDEPSLSKLDPSQQPVYEFALTSPSLPPVELRVFSEEELARELTLVQGVANVDISGGVQEEVQINLDLQRMQAAGVDVATVVEALSDRNQDVSGGLLRGGNEESLTRLVGKFQSADEIRNLRVGPATQPVRLGDVAEIVDGTEEQRVFVTLNGEGAIKVSIQKQPDANTISTVDGVKARLAQLRESGLIPQDTVITATLDESRFIRSSIRSVINSGLTGAGLAAVAVLLFLGSLRQTLIIMLAIPLAILLALGLMSLFGLTLNVFSLGGLAMGVGIVVDNSIVMLENISQAQEEMRGQSIGSVEENSGETFRGSREWWIRTVEVKSQELESALVASTTTNLVSVVPFLLVGGFISLLFNELILTISFAVAGSLAVALTVVPMLAARGLKTRPEERVKFTRAFDQKIEGLAFWYTRMLARVLRYRGWAIALIAFICIGSSAWMVDRIPQEILPRISTGQATVIVQFPPGTAAAQNRRAMTAIDQELRAQPEVASTFTTAGGFLFGNATSENALRGSSTIVFKPDTDLFAWIDRADQRLQSLPLIDTRIRLNPSEVRGLILNNSPVRAEIDVVLQGEDTATLAQAGQQVVSALGGATLASYRPEADPPRPEVQIFPDEARIADLELSYPDIGETLQTTLSGNVATELQRGSRLVDLNVQLPAGTLQSPEQLASIPLFTTEGAQIRLGDLTRIQPGQAPAEVQRINQRQIFLIGGSLSEGASLSEALAEVDTLLAGIELPEGISRLPSAAGETSRQIQSALKLLGGLAAFLVFIVMAVQYNSLIDPLVIMLAVPLALTGGLLGLWVTQTAIGATVIVGAVLLVGIVVNNAIILVELANQIRDRDRVSRAVAILKAAPQRLRPILMTTLTTVLGLFPLALGMGEGSEFLQPLGVVVFSGLSFATLLTLFVVPCFYTLLHRS
jgi:multidrug efflux pump subunit AcrB